MFYIKYKGCELTDHSEIVIDEGYSGLNPMQFGDADCEAGWSFGPAVREHWLLHFVVSGKGYFERDGFRHTVREGEIFVIPPYLETYYEADKKDPWNYIWVGFTADIELPEAFSKPIIRNPAAGDIFKSMERCRSMESGKSAFLSGKLWELISATLESGEGDTDYIEKALNCMRSEYMNDISVSTIAERLNLDRSYFSTLFKKRLGISPGQYLMNLRLQKAAELMTVYGESPSTASLSVGYSDLYHFSKAFKQKFGLSPRAYKKTKENRP